MKITLFRLLREVYGKIGGNSGALKPTLLLHVSLLSSPEIAYCTFSDVLEVTRRVQLRCRNNLLFLLCMVFGSCDTVLQQAGCQHVTACCSWIWQVWGVSV